MCVLIYCLFLLLRYLVCHLSLYFKPFYFGFPILLISLLFWSAYFCVTCFSLLFRDPSFPSLSLYFSFFVFSYSSLSFPETETSVIMVSFFTFLTATNFSNFWSMILNLESHWIVKSQKILYSLFLKSASALCSYHLDGFSGLYFFASISEDT